MFRARAARRPKLEQLNTPAILQSKLDALNLTQIINEPTRYLPKAVNTDTLIDITLTNLPSKYTSAVFNQDLSDQLINCPQTAHFNVWDLYYIH